MTFCGQCGKQTNPSEPFCTSCGAKVSQNIPNNQNTQSDQDANGFQNFHSSQNTQFNQNSQYTPHPSLNYNQSPAVSEQYERLAKLVIFQIVAIIAAAILQILDGVALGIIVNSFMAIGLYILGYKPLRVGTVKYAKYICTGCAALCAVVTILAIFKLQVHYVVVYGIAAMCGYYVFRGLKT